MVSAVEGLREANLALAPVEAKLPAPAAGRVQANATPALRPPAPPRLTGRRLLCSIKPKPSSSSADCAAASSSLRVHHALNRLEWDTVWDKKSVEFEP